MTQWGRRLIRKHQKWVKPSEVEVRVQRDMEDRGANHDSGHPEEECTPIAPPKDTDEARFPKFTQG